MTRKIILSLIVSTRNLFLDQIEKNSAIANANIDTETKGAFTLQKMSHKLWPSRFIFYSSRVVFFCSVTD